MHTYFIEESWIECLCTQLEQQLKTCKNAVQYKEKYESNQIEIVKMLQKYVVNTPD